MKQHMNWKLVLSGFVVFLLGACTSGQVKDSVSKSLEKTCRNNPQHCTVYDESAR